MVDLEELRSSAVVPPEELTAKLGIEILEATPDRLVGTMPVEGNRQGYGLLHGGASCVLAETLGSIGAALHGAGLTPQRRAVGLEISATHHRSARGGRVTGVCTPLHLGRSTATYEIVISDEDGRRTVTSRLTCALI